MINHQRIQTYYSVLGAYAIDNTLFEKFTLHEDINIDKDSLIEYIIYENADLPLQVVNLDLLKIKIGLWAKKQTENWLRIYQALYQEYNPLHNFDRFETYTDTGSNETARELRGTDTNTYSENETVDHTGEKTDTFNTTDTTTHGKTETRTDNLSETLSKNFGETQTHTGTETTDHENTAFNAGVSLTARDTLTRNTADTLDHDESGTRANTGTQTVANSGSDTLKKTGTINTDDTAEDERNTTGNIGGVNTENESVSGEHETTHDGHLYGNIGVTTSQKMLEDEIMVRDKYNFFDIVSNQFKKEFCLMIY